MQIQNNTPTLRFPEFEGEWEKKKLGEVADVSKLAGYEFTKHITYEDNGKIIALRGLNIKNNRLDLSDVKYIDNSELHKLERSKLYIDDLMFTYIGTIGEVALIQENERFYLAPNVSRIRVDKKSIVPTYIIQYFNQDKFKNDEVAKYVSSSSQPALSMENVRKFNISFPSLPEQTKIAHFLTAVDEKIQALKKKKSLLEAYKKGLMQQLFAQELRFKDENGEDFAEWEEKKLGEVCEIKKGEQLNKEELTETGDYPCINGGISPSGFTSKFNVNENTITISEGGNSCGYVNYFTTKFWSGGHNYSLIIVDRELTDNNFLFQILKQNESEIMKLRVGSGLPNIQKKDLIEYKMNFPKLKSEQTKIAHFLSAIDAKIAQVQLQIANMETWKKGLLQKMFV